MGWKPKWCSTCRKKIPTKSVKSLRNNNLNSNISSLAFLDMLTVLEIIQISSLIWHLLMKSLWWKITLLQIIPNLSANILKITLNLKLATTMGLKSLIATTSLTLGMRYNIKIHFRKYLALNKKRLNHNAKIYKYNILTIMIERSPKTI